jgi:oxaloacetate decarboxylase gamma subunit
VRIQLPARWAGCKTGVKVQGDIVSQGGELMLYGMGTVVVFLALLVVSTTAMSRAIGRFFPDPETSLEMTPARPQGRDKAGDDPNLIAVISATIRRYRNR